MILPHNTDIEDHLLASIILMPDNIHKIIDLDPIDFYNSMNQKIFGAMLVLKARKDPIELPMLGAVLESRGYLDDKIGKHLTNIADNSEVALNPFEYSKKVRDYSKARDLMISCMNILDKCKQSDAPDKIIEYAQEQIMSVEPTGARDKFYDSEKLMMDTVNRIDKSQKSKNKIGINLGLVGIENRMFVSGSRLIYISARPGQGKTALMLAMVKHIGLQNIKVGVLSIEMDKEELTDRMMSAETGINSLTFYNPGKLTREDFSKIDMAADTLSTLPIQMNDSKSSIEDVVRRCRRMKKDGCKIIFIDQLSKISYAKSLSEFQGYTKNSNRLAELKKELRIPLVVLCQLGRKVEETATKRPQMIYLKQTGAIEEDGDVILFIYRPGVYGLKNNAGEKHDKSFTEIIMAKCRNGIPGSDFTTKFDIKKGCFNFNNIIKYGDV